MKREGNSQRVTGTQVRRTEMLELKSCPRCKGDMHTNRDMYGAYKECLQCGHMQDIQDPNRLASLLEYATKKQAA